jgi:serine/alanine adding enzyme
LNFELITGHDRLLDLGWDEFVASHAEGTIFQSPVMFELFSSTERMEPVLIGVQDEKTGLLYGILLGVVIREMNGLSGYFSSRTVIYGGPLISPKAANQKEIIKLLLSGLINMVKNKSIFIQFRNFYDMAGNDRVFKDNNFYHRDRLNLILDTSNAETVRKNMSPSRLRQIRKGLGLGAQCIEPSNLEQVREFYDILAFLYRYKVKKPLPAWDFFEQFYRKSKEGRLGIIRLVEYEGKIIGGILSPVTPGKTIYEWYVCGLDKQYKAVHPSVLATWSAIDYAVKNNIPEFDFMGVGIPDREYGVREFKSRFGGRQVNFGRFARINNRIFYSAAEAGYNFLALLKKI